MVREFWLQNIVGIRKKFDKYMRYFVVDHPNQLPLALGDLNKRKIQRREAILVVSLHSHWKNIDKAFIESFFSKVIYLPRPDFSWFIPKHFLYLLYTRVFFKSLNIERNDVFYCFSACQLIENLIVSTYKSNYKELIVPESVFGEYDSKKKYKDFKETSLAKIYNLAIYPLFGMYKTKRLIHKDSLFWGFPIKAYDGGKTHMYKDDLSFIYSCIIVCKNINQPLIRHTHSNVIEEHYPFPALLHKSAKLWEKELKQNIIFLGSNFIGESTMKTKLYVKYLNLCLDYLRKFYNEDRYNLFYKKHPAEDKEIDYLNLEDFEILNTRDSMEIYLIRNSTANVKAVFSVASTALRSSLNFGLNSYVFFQLFPFPKRTLEYYDNLFGRLPKNSYVKSFETKVKDIF